jgi:SAM-dependent methyltransferase
MHNLISTLVTQFAYFDQLLGGPAWKGRKVLDFGGNMGTFLVGASDRVDHDDYWCIDLNREVIERGRQAYPQAHFVHYDRYSSQYNPQGTRHLPIPNCGLKFDIIVAFSVFTHTHQSEMFELVEQLRDMLSPAGVLAFTFTDARYDRSLSDPELPAGSDVRKMLQRNRVKNTSRDIDQIVQRACEAKWCLLIDEELHVEPGDEFSHQQRRGQPDESYCAYYAVDYMASLFPDAKVHPPVNPEWQHCCLFRKTA